MLDPLLLLQQMWKEMDCRAREVDEYEDWYEGEHPVPEPPPNTAAATDAEARRAFVSMSKLAITNFLPPIVDHPVSRLRVEGFRFTQSKTATDADLWGMWRRNHLVSDMRFGICEAVKVGQVQLIVWPGADGRAEITVEDPKHCLVKYEAGSRRRRAAALKRWIDDDGYYCANVYLSDGIYKFRSKAKADQFPQMPTGQQWRDAWMPREVPGEAWPVPNPWGVVPMIELAVNRGLEARPYGGGEPQFEGQLTTQQRINRTVMGRLVTEDYQSFRQRWVTGWDFPVDEQGNPDRSAVIKASASRLMVFEDEGASVGEFAQADFSGFLRAVQEDVKVMASTSATPPYAFLLGDMVNVASDALARIEGTALSIVAGLADQLGDGIAEAMRLGLLMEGDQRWADDGLSVVWGEFEQRTATEQANLAQIMDGLGAPKEVVFATLPGIDQAEARRWKDQAAAEALIRAAQAPVAPPAAQPAP